MKLIYKVLILVLFTLLFVGCGAITIDKESVKQYKKPTNVSSDETLVYVIRESSFVGGARGLWIGHNKNVVADIGSGDYTYFKVKEGINTINAVQTKTGTGYYAIDKVHQEPLFLKYNYITGKIEKLSNDLGISYISNYDESKVLTNKRPNDGYINGLLNLAMYENLNIMTETNTTLLPDSNNAVITFIRHDSFADILKYTIWDDKGIVGNLDAQSYFQVKVPKGKHYFYVKSQVTYALEADVEANKNYVVELNVGMGWTTAHVKLIPIDLEKSDKNLSDYETLPDIEKWKKASKHLKLEDNLDDNIKERVKLALLVIEKIKAKIISGNKTPEKLKMEYGQ